MRKGQIEFFWPNNKITGHILSLLLVMASWPPNGQHSAAPLCRSVQVLAQNQIVK
jgi:hypothetical protein